MPDIKPENVNLGENTDIRGSVSLNNVKIGSRTKIRDYSIIYGSKDCPAIIGEDCWVGAFCYFNGFWGLEIGDRVSFGHSIYIHTDTGPDAPNKLLEIYPVKKGKIKIGNDVWINTNAIILPGVTIGNRVVILPNTLVSRDVQDGVVFGGMPAKIVKKIS